TSKGIDLDANQYYYGWMKLESGYTNGYIYNINRSNPILLRCNNLIDQTGYNDDPIWHLDDPNMQSKIIKYSQSFIVNNTAIIKITSHLYESDPLWTDDDMKELVIQFKFDSSERGWKIYNLPGDYVTCDWLEWHFNHATENAAPSGKVYFTVEFELTE
ncbi:MAG: hypothetical protein ABFD66_15815, partial [Smithella sp.]